MNLPGRLFYYSNVRESNALQIEKHTEEEQNYTNPPNKQMGEKWLGANIKCYGRSAFMSTIKIADA